MSAPSEAQVDARTPPHNLDAERSVLGAMMLQNNLVDAVVDVLQPRDFYRHAHQVIYQHVLLLHEARSPIDFVTLRESMESAGALAAGTGATTLAYVAALIDGVPHASNVDHYAAIVREKSQLRTIIAGAQRMQALAYDTDEDARDVIDQAEHVLFDLAMGETREGFKQLKDILPAVLEQIETWHRTKQGVTGLASGFIDLDDMTCGFQPSDLIVIGARPSMGKSSLILNIAQYATLSGKSVGLFSLEMSETDLAIRTLTAQAGIDSHRLRRGYIRESEWSRLALAMGELAGLKLFIDESPFITVFEMRSRARRLKAEHGLDLLIIDYTQLMVGHERRENRTLELGAISRSLKALAKDLKIPILALSQLSRKCEERTDKRPMLSDLRESGALEQDADLVIFIYRGAVYEETDENRNMAELIIAKQRNGPIGTVKLTWIPEETRFANYVSLQEAVDQRLPITDR